MIRKIANPMAYGTLFAAVAVKEKDQPSVPPTAVQPIKIRASDLPVYSTIDNQKKCHSAMQSTSETPGTVEESIGFVRKNISSVYNSLWFETKRIDDFYQTGKEHSRFIIDYLNEPSNTVSRTGAIALGGASGFIIGLRGGIIKRFLYTLIGSGAVASVCYPKEADKYAQLALVEAKQAVTIAYNFAYGVKPGEEVKAPKIPSNYSEIVDNVRSWFK